MTIAETQDEAERNVVESATQLRVLRSREIDLSGLPPEITHGDPDDAVELLLEESHTDRQSTLLIRTAEPIIDPAWTVEEVGLEDVVLAYMGRPAADAEPTRIGR